MKPILAILLISFTLTLGQNQAQLTSASDVAQVDSKTIDLSRDFVYTVFLPQGAMHYKINMHDDLYRSHNAFIWPPRVPDSLKLAQVFYADGRGKQSISEIIFNNRIIFSTTPELHIKHPDGDLIPLKRVASPGITKILGPVTISYITNRSNDKDMPTPIFHYTLGGKSDFILVRQPGKVSVFIAPNAPTMTYNILQVSLKDLPTVPPILSLPPLENHKDLEEQQSEVTALLEQQRRDDFSWLDSIGKNLIEFPPQGADESDSAFALRKVMYAQELAAHLDVISENFPPRYKVFEERLRALKLAQAQITPENPDAFVPHPLTELQRKWNGSRIFIGLSTMLGGNLPLRVANPGPTNLRNVSLRLGYGDIIARSAFAWQLHSTNHLQLWKYNADVSNTSRRMSTALGASLSTPILVQQSPTSAQNIFVELGVIGQYARNEIKKMRNTIHQGFAWGGQGALGFLWGKGYSVKLSYQYTSDLYGELNLGFQLPLYRFSSEVK